MTLDTVNALRKGKQAGLVKLCDVFLLGDVKALQEFQKKEGIVFEEHGLNVEEAMSKIRLLTLATVMQNMSEISLEEIAQKLDEDATTVERTVVRAISEGIVDGRIDQLNKKLLVKSAFQRKFEKEEWAFLDNKLTQWIDNL